MKRISLATSLLVVLATSAVPGPVGAAETGTWVEAFGAAEPQIGSMVADPRSPGRIWMTTFPQTSFIARPYGSHDLYRSDDAGRRWSLVERGVPAHFLALGATPTELYLSGSSSRTVPGVWRSRDAGRTWEYVDGFDDDAFGIFTSPGDPDQLFVLDDSFTLFRSTDRGASYKRSNGVSFVSTMIVDATDPSIVIAGSLDGLIYRSGDGGANFTQVEGSPAGPLYDERARNIVQDPFDPASFYLANSYAYRPERSVLVSRDRGRTWSASGKGLPHGDTVDDVEADPFSSGRLYASAGNGLYVSTDRGGSWAPAPARGLYRGAFLASEGVPHEGRYVYDAAVAAKDSVFVGSVHGSREFYSDDAGATFTHASPPQPTARQEMESVATTAADPAVVWATGADGWVYRSTDGGRSYAYASGDLPDPNFLPVGIAYLAFIFSPYAPTLPRNGGRAALAVDPTDAERAWIARTTRVFRTEDAGKTWIASTRLPDVWDVVVNPDDPRSLYAATRAGPYRSTDGGATWTDATAGMGPLEVWALAHAPSDPATIYAATYPQGLWVSRGGGPWSLLPAQGLPPERNTIAEIAVLPGSPAVLIASTLGGSYRSTDGGATFNPLPGVNGQVTSVVAWSPSSSYLTAAFPGGLYVSHDRGMTFTEYEKARAHLDPEWVGSVAASPDDPRRAVVGSLGTFVYEPPDIE